jgi:Predicted membrane protein
MKFKVSETVTIGIFSCLVLVGSFVNIRLPFASQGGLVHLGTTIAVIATIIYGRKIGMLSGAIGMSLFDILGGWLIWAPATFVARLGLGFVLGTIAYFNCKKGKSYIYNLLGLISGGAWMILIYYLFESIIYRNWIIAIASIPGNIFQLVLAAIVGIPIGIILKKYLR